MIVISIGLVVLVSVAALVVVWLLVMIWRFGYDGWLSYTERKAFEKMVLLIEEKRRRQENLFADLADLVKECEKDG